MTRRWGEIGVEDGDPEYLLYQALDAKRLQDGSVLVANTGSAELRIYSSEGTFLRSFGSRGAGPGEFHELADFRSWPVGDSLVFSMDAPRRRFHVFHTSGIVAETRVLPVPLELDGSFWVEDMFPGGAGILGTSAVGFLTGDPGQIISTQLRHLRFDTSGAFSGEVMSLQSRKRVVNRYSRSTHYPFLPFSVGDLIVAGPDTTVFVLLEGTSTVSQHNSRGALLREFEVPAQRRGITPGVYASYREQQLAGLTAEGLEAYQALYARDLPLPSAEPLAISMRLDREGLVWLERFRMPEDTTTVFDVLDPDSMVLRRVIMPKRIKVYDIGRDFILGREADAGVERVVMYHLQRGDD